MHDRIMIVGSGTNLLACTAIDQLLAEAERQLFVPQHLLVVNEPYPSRREHEARMRAEFEKRMREAVIVAKEPEVCLEPAATCPPNEWGQRRHRRPN